MQQCPFFTRERAFFLIITGFAVAILWNFLIPLTLGMALAALSDRQVERIDRALSRWFPHFKQKHSGAVLLGAITLWITALTVLFLLPMTLALVSALADLLAAGGHILENPETSNYLSSLLPKVQAAIVKAKLPFDITPVVQRAQQIGMNILSQFLSLAGQFLSATPGGIFNLATTLIAWIYFGLHGKSIRRRIMYALLPWEKERTLIGETTLRVLHSLVVSSILISIVQAIMITFFMAICQIPRPMTIGLISFFFSFIPFVGTAIVTVTAIVYLLLQGSYLFAGLMLIGALLAGTVDNLIRPFLMKDSIELSFFWLFLSLIGGMTQFGIFGAVLGPLALSLFVAAIRGLETKKRST